VNVAIVGAGWAGLSAAVQLVAAGHAVTVYETARTPGGRARALSASLPDGRTVTVDNGQHILIGAYTETLRLMREVGVDSADALLRLPLTLQFPDGGGLRLPRRLPVPLDVLAGILRADWPLGERLGLVRAALGWKLARFECAPTLSVAQLCHTLGPQVMRELIGPLCVSALNTPAEEASGRVFLRVLRDALFSVRGGSNLLLPRQDLGRLFPAAASLWLRQHGAVVHMGHRATDLRASGPRWRLDGQPCDAVLLASASAEAARLVAGAADGSPQSSDLHAWARRAAALRFEAITTVYAWSPQARLPAPMLALPHDDRHPAQFVFDRGQLDGTHGLLAFVISASHDEREVLQARVLQQASEQLGLTLEAVQTVVEKRATFACTPQLQRPATFIAPGLLACGDYIDGPYPATIEGAVRSGIAAASALQS